MLLQGVENPEISNDPEIMKAWDAVQHHPELRRWFEAQREFDKQVRTSLGEFHVPDVLRRDILEQAAKARRQPFGNFWNGLVSHWGMWVALAAAVVLMTGFAFRNSLINNQNFWYLPQWSAMEKESNFRDAMAVFVDDTLINLDYLSEDRHSIRQWLVGQGGAALKRFPESFLDLTSLGCKTLKWKGKTVSLICFHYGKNDVVHLFVMDRRDASEMWIQNLGGMKRVHNLETGGWLTPNYAVMLVGSDPKVNIEPLLDQSSI